MCRLICTFVVSMTFKQVSHDVVQLLSWATAQQNQQNDLCARQRLRSAWASTKSDQSSLSAWRNLGSLATHWAHSEDSDQTGWMPRLICVLAGRTGHIVGFLMMWLNYKLYWRKLMSHDLSHDFVLLYWPKADVTWLVISWLWLVFFYTALKLMSHDLLSHDLSHGFDLFYYTALKKKHPPVFETAGMTLNVAP